MLLKFLLFLLSLFLLIRVDPPIQILCLPPFLSIYHFLSDTHIPSVYLSVSLSVSLSASLSLFLYPYIPLFLSLYPYRTLFQRQSLALWFLFRSVFPLFSLRELLFCLQAFFSSQSCLYGLHFCFTYLASLATRLRRVHLPDLVSVLLFLFLFFVSLAIDLLHSNNYLALSVESYPSLSFISSTGLSGFLVVQPL